MGALKSPHQKSKLPKGVVRRAIRDDVEAIETIFRQFVGDEERIRFASYFGLKGLWHIGAHSLGCLTDKRIASLHIGWLGQVEYHDGYLEKCNGLQIRQPSLFLLYMCGLMFILFTAGIGLLLLPMFVKLYYRVIKSGMIVHMRGSQDIDIFCDRGQIVYLNRLARLFRAERENRIRHLSLLSAEEMAAEEGSERVESPAAPPRVVVSH